MTPLGKLLRKHRQPLGWERAVAATGLKERALRGYESSGVMPPLDKALIIARAYGITLEELTDAVLGTKGSTGRHAGAARAIEEAEEAAREADALSGTAPVEDDPERDQDEPQPRPSR